MKKVSKMSLGDLAAYICSYLYGKGVKCILTGGACVSIYTDNKYLSYDLDFIENTDVPRKEIKKFLAEIGFREENRYFVNDDTPYIIEFPSGPLSAGSEPITEYNQIDFETGRLFLLKPTDCVKDRLVAYFHWDDLQALEQALLVSRKKKINIKEIKRWSAVENNLKKFDVFLKKMKSYNTK